MSKENAIKFLRELNTNEKAKALMEGREKPDNTEELVKIYIETAAQLGESISAEDFRAAIEEMKADMSELEDDNLDDVAGGIGIVPTLQVAPGIVKAVANAVANAHANINANVPGVTLSENSKSGM
jgi:hypothetical protein